MAGCDDWRAVMSTGPQPFLLGYSGLSDQFVPFDNEDELLTAAVRWLGQQASADWVVAYLINEQGRSIVFNLRYVWLHASFTREAGAPHPSNVRDVSWRAGVLGRAAGSKMGMVLSSPAEFESDAKDLYFDFGPTHSAAVLPIVSGGQTVAILAMGRQASSLQTHDFALLSLINAVASTHWSRQAASRDAGISNKALQKLVQGLSTAASALKVFRQISIRPADFLSALVKVPLGLVRAQGCLILTYEPSTDGLFEEGCYFWNSGDGRPVRAQENVFVELVRALRGKRQLHVESDLSDPRSGGVLNKLAQGFSFLSCLSAPISLFAERESLLVLFSWSRNGFGKLERSVLELVQQLLEVLAAANEAGLTVAYFQRTSVMAHQIAGTTHELRNATSYAARYLTYMLRDLAQFRTIPSLPSEIAGRLPQVVNDANRLKKQLELIMHRVEILRQFRRKEEVRFSAQHFDLNKLIQEIVEASQTLADPKNILIETELDKTLPQIESDPLLIQECVSNLLINAIYFTGPTGRVKVGTQYNPYFPDAKGRSEAGTRHTPVTPSPVLIWVFDEGGGIHRSEQQKIFEPFYSTKPQRSPVAPDGAGGAAIPTKPANEFASDQSGTGLGLFLTKNNVTLLGGTIAVESVIPKWTKFTIQLPLRLSKRLPHV
jgi:signal transduction histidine kinase